MDFFRKNQKNGKEDELEKEIKSLNVRKAAVVSSIESEITKLQNEINNVYLEAGKQACLVWLEKGEHADIKNYCEKLQELNKGIQEWEDKRIEMTKRFEEEIALIRPVQNIGNTAPTVAGGGKTCPGCGIAVADDDMFCQGCGRKLQ
jgi:uncharacterized coiled-coil DUF342 family protein